MAARLITFDMTGTLLRFRVPPAEQYVLTAKQYGFHVKEIDQVKLNFKKAFKRMTEHYPNFGLGTELSWTGWWLQVVMRSLSNESNNSQLEHIAWHLIKLYSTAQPWELCPGVVDTLRRLKQENVTLGVISNFDPRLDQIIHQVGISHFFDFILSSYSAGFMKPNPGIFAQAQLKAADKLKTRLEPEDCCHIGDTYETDYMGAVKSGWNSFLIGKSENFPVSVNRQHILNSIGDISSRLGFN